MAKRNKAVNLGDGARAIVYLRVSTGEQVVSGLGLEAQELAARAMCLSRGWSVELVVVDEGVSGSVAPTKRPGMSHAVELLCAGEADILVGAKLDRLSRSTLDLLALCQEADRCGFAVVAADGSVDMTSINGEFMTTVLAASAQMERRVIGARTRSALAVKRAQGHRFGRPPITSQVIRFRAAELRGEGMTLASVAATLNAEGFRTSTGTEWSAPGVARFAKSLRLDAAAEAIRNEVRG